MADFNNVIDPNQLKDDINPLESQETPVRKNRRRKSIFDPENDMMKPSEEIKTSLVNLHKN